MTHRFPIKEIATQAGLGTATVDRVLNARANVSARTKARVVAAIAELERQEQNLAAKGRAVWVDVVVEAPLRFSREVKSAAESVCAQSTPVVLRPRFTLHEVMTETQMIATLQRIGKRGSQGICLKARNLPGVQKAVAGLMEKGIPVVTLVTDIDGALGYAGLDNEQAGRVAAALVARDVQHGVVLTSQSREDFAGEAERISAFRAALARRAPNVQVFATTEGGGLNQPTERAISNALHAAGRVAGIYSAGGGNRAITTALRLAGIDPRIYVAHDLDADNLVLLEQGKITFVLHHDLEADMQNAFRQILQFHKLIAPFPSSELSDVQIVMAENLPARFRPQSGK